MRNIAAYLLCVLGGNQNPDAAAINKILGSVGVEGDSAKIEKLISELNGKDVYEVIAQGMEKLTSVPTGAPAAVASSAPAAAAASSAPAQEEKEKKEEPKEESDEDMGFGLFD